MNIIQDLSLFLLRAILAYGFYGPAMMKWQSMPDVVQWFKDLNIPLPVFSAYLSASFEIIGVVLLILGLFTRWICVPLMIIMMVAITLVHWNNGFDASNNGFEIPLYYLLMLFTLMSFGGGQWSADMLLMKRTSFGKKYL